MASVNGTSLREEFDAARARIAALRKAGRISHDVDAVIGVLCSLLGILIAIFLEKTTRKTGKNSSIPPSQTDKDNTGKQMRIAKTMLHGLQRQIGWPAIVNDRSCQSRWDITSPGPEPKMTEGCGTQHMQPARLAGNPQAGLIQMLHGNSCAGQQFPYPVRENAHAVGLFGDQTGQRRRGDPDLVEVGEDPRQTILGNAVLCLQVGRQGSDFVTVLDGGFHGLGKGSAHQRAACPA